MKPTITKLTVLLMAVVTLPIAAADDDSAKSRIYFKSGGSMLGTVIAEPKENRKAYLVIRTASGSTIKVEKSKVIQRVAENTRNLDQYKTKLAATADNPDDHWEMYFWCKEQSSKFKEQLDYHLRQIVKLDPSDKKAWQLLEHIEVDGRWVPEEQHYRSRGYVKHKGRWVSKLQLEFNQETDASETDLNTRKKALRNWKQNTLRTGDYETIRNELFKLIDPVSVRYFTDNFLKREKDPELRNLYIEAIGRVPNRTAQSILIRYAMQDEVPEVRDQAILQLEQETYDKRYTASRIARYLNHSSNELVNRAGYLLANFKQPNVILPLISSLHTRHKFATGSDPGRMNTRFDANGGVGFSAGDGPKTVEVARDNQGVLEALTETTGQNFEFDIDLWREWYIKNRTLVEPDLRGEIDN